MGSSRDRMLDQPKTFTGVDHYESIYAGRSLATLAMLPSYHACSGGQS
jgi:hypothetical protein